MTFQLVWNKIKEYTQEGLTWGETFKLEPVAFGIKKLVMTASIVDSLVSYHTFVYFFINFQNKLFSLTQ